MIWHFRNVLLVECPTIYQISKIKFRRDYVCSVDCQITLSKFREKLFPHELNGYIIITEL